MLFKHHLTKGNDVLSFHGLRGLGDNPHRPSFLLLAKYFVLVISLLLLLGKIRTPNEITLVIGTESVDVIRSVYTETDVAMIIFFAMFAAVSSASILRSQEGESVSNDYGPPNNIRGSSGDLYAILLREGAMYQSRLVEESGMSKGQVSKLLCDLQDRGLIRKDRHGMSNIIAVVRE